MKEMAEKQASMMRINEKLMQLFEKRSFSKSFERSRTIEEPIEEEEE